MRTDLKTLLKTKNKAQLSARLDHFTHDFNPHDLYQLAALCLRDGDRDLFLKTIINSALSTDFSIPLTLHQSRFVANFLIEDLIREPDANALIRQLLVWSRQGRIVVLESLKYLDQNPLLINTHPELIHDLAQNFMHEFYALENKARHNATVTGDVLDLIDAIDDHLEKCGPLAPASRQFLSLLPKDIINHIGTTMFVGTVASSKLIFSPKKPNEASSVTMAQEVELSPTKTQAVAHVLPLLGITPYRRILVNVFNDKTPFEHAAPRALLRIADLCLPDEDLLTWHQELCEHYGDPSFFKGHMGERLQALTSRASLQKELDATPKHAYSDELPGKKSKM